MEEKKPPKKIVIDSNIILADPHFKGSNFRIFFDGLKKIGAKLYIPQVVIDEVCNNFSEELQKYTDSYNNLIKKLHKLTNTKFTSMISRSTINKEIKKYTNELKNHLKKAKTLIVKYPKISHKLVVQRLLSKRKPFLKDSEKKEVGYRDFLIWETILLIAKEKDETVVFITNNYKDYADNLGNLHPDFAKDIEKRGLKSDSIILSKNLEKFVDDYIIPKMIVLEDIRLMLSKDQCQLFELEKFIMDQLAELNVNAQFDPSRIGFPHFYERPTLSYIDEISNIEVIDVRRLSSGELLATLQFGADCEFHFYIYKSDYYDMDEDKRPYVFDYNWSQNFVAASATKWVTIKLKLTINEDSHKATSIEIESIYK